jgi:hypothetical protein
MSMRRRGCYILGGQTRGRPRERRRVGEYPERAIIDACKLRREALERGEPIGGGAWLTLRYAGADGACREARIRAVAEPHPIYRARWWLLCPACGRRCGRVYVVKGGPQCRVCLRLRYDR